MTIKLPNDLESSLRAEVVSGHFASEEDAVAAIVREYFQHKRRSSPSDTLDREIPSDHILGSMREDADLLDEIVDQAMKNRAEQPWRSAACE